MSLILEHITKSFNNIKVLDDFSALFKDGCAYAVMGVSGKGKTTLINIIMGLIQPDYGNISSDKELSFSTIFQEDRLCENMDAIGNIKLVLNKNINKDHIADELAYIGLGEAAGMPVSGKPVAEFSGGMKRRVAIVRALMSKSDVLIMDEPFKGLDIELREVVIDYIKSRRNKRMLILVTHDKADAEAFEAEIISL